MKNLFHLQIFLICCLTISHTLLFSQNYNLDYQNITVSDGLSDNYVLCMIQDRDGFIWMGTENGLNRYDGYNVKTFHQQVDQSLSLSDNNITALYEHPSGLIWVGTKNGGLNIFDPIKETFTFIPQEVDQQGTLIHSYVTAITGSVFGGVWVGTQGGVQYITTTPEGYPLSFENYTVNGKAGFNIHSNKIYCLLEASDSTLWIGSNEHGLGRVFLNKEGKPRKFLRYLNKNRSPGGLTNGAVMDIYEDSQSRIWVGNWKGGLHLYNPASDNFHAFMPNKNQHGGINNEYVYTICEDQQGSIWVGTYGGGLNRIVRGDSVQSIQFETFNFDHLGVDPVRDYRIRTMLMDHSGVLWIGSLGGGVKKMVQRPQQFSRLDGQEITQYSDIPYAVSSMMIDRKNRLWVGAKGYGLHSFQLNQNESEKQHLTSPQYYLDQHHGLAQVDIHMIYEDIKNNIWIGTDQGLHVIEAGTEELKQYNYHVKDLFSLSNNNILNISEDKQGRLWIGTEEGLNLYDPKIQGFRNFRNDYAFVFEFTEKDDIDILIQTNSGKYFAGGNWFFGELDQNLEKGVFLWEAGKIESDFLKYKVQCIFEASDDKLWIGTQKGLSLYEQDSGLVHFNGRETLIPYMINSIQEDQLGYLWLGTPAGLLKFNPKTGTLKHHNIQGRSSLNNFSSRASSITSNGIISFGTSNGVVYFQPSQLNVNDYFPPVIVNDLRISNKSISVQGESEKRNILKKPIHLSSDIELLHTNDVFTLEFVVLSHFQQDEYQYAYRLEGVDEEWNYTDAQNRSVTYAKLSPGTYIFQVKAANRDGIWSDQVKTLRIHIQPPFWKSKTAYFCYLLLLIILIYTSKQYTRKRIELENELKVRKIEQEKIAEVHQMKVNFFTNISHELRTPLTLISTPLEGLLKNTSHKNREIFELMHHNSLKLLRLVNQLIDFQKQEEGKITLKAAKADLVLFTQRITNVFKGLASEKEISLHFSEKSPIMAWFDSDQLEKVMYNLLSNALKFTGKKGNVWVSVEETDQDFQIIVKDDGPGVAPKDIAHIFERFYQSSTQPQMHIGTGIGLAFSKHLVELHHGNIGVESQLGEGATFKVNLQKGNTHFDLEEIQDSPHDHILETDNRLPFSSSKSLRDISHFSHPTSTPCVLIVEDNIELRNYLGHILSESYRIKLVENAQKAWEYCLNEEPDLIISDVMMPGMDGWSFCHQIKTDIQTSHIPMILLTAKTCQNSRMRGFEAGADDYLSKPFHAEELQLKIHNLLETRHRFKAYFRRTFIDNNTETPNSLSSPDQQLLDKASSIIHENIDNSSYDVNQLTKDIGISRSLLYAKFSKLTGYSPNDFIKITRLKKAALLLQNPEWGVGDASSQVGFKSTKYFSKCFKAFFGMSPTEYKEQHTNHTVR